MQAAPHPLPNTHHSVAVHFLRLLTDYAAQRKLSAASLLHKAGISETALHDPNGRVPFVKFNQLCEIAGELLNEPCIGLKLGQSVRPGHLGSHGFALMSCSTGAELMQQHVRYSALTIDAAHTAFETRGNEHIRYWRSNLPGGVLLGRLQDELNQSIWITLARWFANRPELSPNWAAFRHAKPADISEYEAIFRCPLRFGAAETGLGFDISLVNIPMPHANAQLRRIMDDLCAQLLKQLGDALEPIWLSIARRTVLESFKHGEPDISTVTQATGLTEAKLKEQLAQRGMSFRGFIDDLRHALALGYARDPSLGLVDIAYLLGFSEQSAFQRAFKRWTGLTPGDYRRNPPLASGVA